MYLQSLQLQNFRKFKNIQFDFTDGVNILIGDNGSGKSSCIEAISLLTNGKSPFTNDLSDILNWNDDFFKIEAVFSDESCKSLIYNKVSCKYLINGKKKGATKFSSYTKSNLFSPEQIDILMLSPSARRKFLDDIICNIDYKYAFELNTFSKTLRQRNKQLKKLAEIFYKTGAVDEKNVDLSIWTQKLAQISSDIIFKRSNFITEINSVLEKDGFIEYKSSLGLGDFEDMLDKKSLIKKHNDIYSKNIRREIAIGYSLYGAHRDDWHLFGFDRDIHKYGSRGEKRFVIGSFIYCLQELYKNMLGQYPILILDDLQSELDDNKIRRIFNNKIIKNQQVFISGIRDEIKIRKANKISLT
jgi:DNA replication and repair protein RecF